MTKASNTYTMVFTEIKKRVNKLRQRRRIRISVYVQTPYVANQTVLRLFALFYIFLIVRYDPVSTFHLDLQPTLIRKVKKANKAK